MATTKDILKKEVKNLRANNLKLKEENSKLKNENFSLKLKLNNIIKIVQEG